jgi:hypothetical protein
VHVLVDDDVQPESNIKQLLEKANIEIGPIREIEPSLEDVFIASMGP